MENTENTEIKKRKKRILSRNKSAIKARKETAKKKKPKIKKVKKKPYEYRGKFLPYIRAKKVVKVLALNSRAEYIAWHDKYEPDYLPKRPDNAYRKEFEGWIKFLSKPPKGQLRKYELKQLEYKKNRIAKEKAAAKQTKDLKRTITAKIKYDIKKATVQANRLKRRERTALNNVRKENKKIEKRLDIPHKPPHGNKNKRKNITKFIPYNDAKTIIVNEKFASIKEYIAWWDINKPAGIPRRPDRIYENFKWLDYLGKDDYIHKFEKKDYRSMYRTYEDAVLYVRKLRIESSHAWDKYCKEGKCPKDIPRFPHIIYQYRPDDPTWGKWISWDHWLGNKDINLMIEAYKEELKTLIVIVPDGAPPGVYGFIYQKGDEKTLEKFIDDNELYVIRMYKIDVYDWTGYLSRRYSNYMGQPNLYIINNINETLFDLDNYMERLL